MAKEISGYVKLQIKGGQANPAPPVGPALGQRGVNIMDTIYNTRKARHQAKMKNVHKTAAKIGAAVTSQALKLYPSHLRTGAAKISPRKVWAAKVNRVNPNKILRNHAKTVGQTKRIKR